MDWRLDLIEIDANAPEGAEYAGIYVVDSSGESIWDADCVYTSTVEVLRRIESQDWPIVAVCWLGQYLVFVAEGGIVYTHGTTPEQRKEKPVIDLE